MAMREFPAVLLEVTDADSVWMLCDQGFNGWQRIKVRLVDAACRELKDPGGPEAKEFTKAILPARSFPPKPSCIVYSYKWYKYSEAVMGDILLFNGRYWRELMIEAGYAVPWNGAGSQPKPPWPIAQASSGPLDGIYGP